MTLRKRFLITAALLCHLLLAPPLVTSQLPPGIAAQATPCALAAAAQKDGMPTICAIEQEE
jgi:hypothetical protein